MFILCSPCHLVVQVVPEGTESDRDIAEWIGRNSEFWPDRYPCVRCAERAQYLDRLDPSLDVAEYCLRSVTPKELFAGLYGMGFPEEQSITVERASKTLCGAVCVGVTAHEVRGDVILTSLQLQNGTTLFLGSGPEGAVVYRIRPPFSYTEKAVGRVKD